MSNAREISLGDALEMLIDHRGKTPAKLGGELTDSGIRVISAINIKNRRVDNDNLRYVSEDTYDRWMPEKLKAGDVLLTSEAPLGELAYLSSDTQACLGQRLFALRPRSEILNGRFLFYLLTSGDARDQLLSRATGSTVSGIRQSELIQIKLHLPPVVEQRAIAGVLGALDDKIESNRRVWKMRLQIATATYESFRQSSTTFSSLKDLYKVGLSGVWGEEAPSEKSPAPTSCLRGKDLEEFLNGEAESSPTRYISNRQLESRTFVDGEIWTAGSGTLGPSLLITNASAKRWRHQLTYSNFVKRLVPTGTHLRHATAWQSVYRAWITDEFPAYRTGTAMPNLDADALLHGVQVPELSKMEDQKISELTTFALDAQSLIENDRLAALRDTLLPELLSGRIRVRDAESIVEDAL